MTEHWFDIIDKMLCLDPNKRLSASQALQHPFFTDPNLPAACQPSDLPVNQMEDHHEFITKAEKNKKKDFRKMYTFRHNLDQTNYNNDCGSDGRHYYDNHFFWKATPATTAST